MNRSNPFTITFGKEPNRIISRYEDVDTIISSFSADNPVCQTFLIEGIRGSGKTVLMTTVAKKLGEDKDWIIINLNPTMDLLSNFAMRLSDACNTKSDLINRGFNISAAGFGVGINADPQSADSVGVIDKAFKTVLKKKKRVLITIDEVMPDDNMRIFASQFQIFVRQDYPIFMIMTGLYENIYEIQNDPSLTFLLRSPKIETGPLSAIQIIRQYKEIFDLDDDEASKLAYLTKGYAFAFQALGVAYWNNHKKSFDAVLNNFDELLDDFVYKKIWSSLSPKEKEIVLAVSEAEVKTGAVCEKVSLTNSSLSRYREKLMLKGILETKRYGYLSLVLPRFYEIAKKYPI